MLLIGGANWSINFQLKYLYTWKIKSKVLEKLKVEMWDNRMDWRPFVHVMFKN